MFIYLFKGAGNLRIHAHSFVACSQDMSVTHPSNIKKFQGFGLKRV